MALCPHSVVLYRKGTGALAALTCRVDLPAGQAGSSERGQAGAVAVTGVTLYAAQDADVQRGDAFVWPSGSTTQYRVTSVAAPATGQIDGATFLQAACEVMES
ncbi:MAG: hypothetical protein IPJ58_16385 [Ardenticatenia bacterium]|nr:hypothetical protein [Ardenticatenia bacterium]